ncbi:uncharacterized protein [Mycetomoellerius zeteki]|uniref:uncharacterized protein n=1 Tax=Mycetomoellerius zeteki TaxID=64791 RepID=UPI00084E4E37|nr:PREDICTED: uncharacterized protein LOC108727564 [Trachymyrmex zeteki]
MERNEFRAVIKHLHMKSLTPKEIKAELDNIHSTSAPAFSTVYNWVNEFKRGRTSTCDAPRSGRPIEAAKSARACRGHRHITWHSDFDFARTIGIFARFSDYFLFPNLKKWFGGKRFTTREQLIAETEAYFEGLDKSYYSDGLKKLENRWIKCIKLKGDYIEK